jgi:hypothetical protein
MTVHYMWDLIFLPQLAPPRLLGSMTCDHGQRVR